jgi:hypothetical protein
LPFKLQAQQTPLTYTSSIENITDTDWLIAPLKQKAAIYFSTDKKNIILYNGLVKRVFATSLASHALIIKI